MKPTSTVPETLVAASAAQAGAFSRQQVLASGATQTLLDRQLRSGNWIRLGQGVYTDSPPVSFEMLCWAGVLRGGDGAAVGGLAAGHLLGICQAPVRITIWGDRYRTSGPWDFRRGPRPCVDELPRLRTDDAILDACSEVPAGEVLGLLTTALRRRITHPWRLRECALTMANLRHRALVLQLLPELEAGVESTLESHFLHRVQRAHLLPEGVRQVSVSAGTRSDVLDEVHRVLYELDGRIGHEGEAKWRDAERDNRHAVLGLTTLRFGWHDVVLRPCQVARMIGQVLAGRGWPGVAGSGLPRRCGPGCTVAS